MNIKNFRFDPAIPRFLYSTDDGAGGGGDKTPTPEERQAAIDAAVQKKFDDLVSKSGGNLTEALTTVIKNLNAATNAKNTAENTIIELRKQIPDDATKAELEAYRAYGKPADIEALKARAEKADTYESDLLFKEAGSLAGFDADVLADLARKNGFSVETKEVEKDGKKAKVPFVGEKPLVDYVTETLPKYLPSLRVEAQQQQSGIPHIRQVNGEQKPNVPLTLEERKAAKLATSEYPTF